jgi:hypothetical protein
MGLDVPKLFELELAQRGVGFTRRVDGTYLVIANAAEFSISLHNLQRNVERDGTAQSVVHFVDHVLIGAPRTAPAWQDVSQFLLFSAESTDQDLSTAIANPISKQVAQVLTFTDAQQSGVTRVTAAMCADWQVSTEQALAAAARNQNELLRGIQMELSEVAGEQLGMVPIDSPYKASVIFAPAFKQFVATLGWPVNVVIPCRDFIYVVAEGSALLGRLGSTVVHEYRSSGYAISTEVLHVGDDGVRALGCFAVD